MADDVTLPGTGAVIAGDEIAGKVFQRLKLIHGVDGVNDGDVAKTNPLPVTLRPAADGGTSIYRNINLVATGVNIKASAGQVYGWYLYNNATATRYVKLYNVSGAPTVGTTTPVMTIPIPAGGAANVAFPNGIAFATGIGIGATTGVADADTGAPSTNDVVVDILYT